MPVGVVRGEMAAPAASGAGGGCVERRDEAAFFMVIPVVPRYHERVVESKLSSVINYISLVTGSRGG
ncbi:MAG: hypothetical protein KC983_01945, partial [Phycisphaerales bacterium]|nr:hypothetical protein [Phycisphaerales bacterium]